MKELEEALMLAGMVSAFFLVGLLGVACDDRTIPEPPNPAPTVVVATSVPAEPEETMVDEVFPTLVPVIVDDLGDEIGVEAPTPLPGEADCGGIRQTLDFLDSPYTIVESTVGPVCVEEDLGVFLYVNSGVSCSTAIDAGVDVQVGHPGAVVYGCEDYTP